MFSKKNTVLFSALLLLNVPHYAYSAVNIEVGIAEKQLKCTAKSVSFDYKTQLFTVDGLSDCPATAFNKISVSEGFAATTQYLRLVGSATEKPVYFSILNAIQTVSDNLTTYQFEINGTNPVPAPNFATIAPTPTPTPTPNNTTPTTVPTPIVSGANGCNDDLTSDYLPCANNSKLIIVNPNVVQETPLPGCAGIVTASPNTCRLDKSMQDEAYAVRLKFKDVLNSMKDQVFYIKGFTTDNMRLDDPRFRKFDMSISTIPGDFEGNNRSACVRKWPKGGTDGTIFAMQYNPGDSASETVCQLTTNTLYYINVRAAEPGCHDVQTDPRFDQSPLPAHGCSISVVTQMLPSNK